MPRFAAGSTGSWTLVLPAVLFTSASCRRDWLPNRCSPLHRLSEGDLARLIFHELAHQVAFAPGDTLFNESFASAVEKIGVERWLARPENAQAKLDSERGAARRADFRALTARYRDELVALYRSDASEAARREGKAALLARLRAEHAALKAGPWGGFSGYDRWFAEANNASFGVLASYSGLVPAFERLFEREGRDFARFYAEVRRLAALPPSAAPRRALKRPSSVPKEPAMADIRIHRSHALGLARARKTARKWAEAVEEKFGMECTVIEGEASDVVEFTRAGVDGKLVVTGDAFELDAKRLILGTFSGKIESEIGASRRAAGRGRENRRRSQTAAKAKTSRRRVDSGVPRATRR